jgi:hypothetical protein
MSLRATGLYRWALGVALALVPALSRAADHRDGSIQQDQPADIADVYAFRNPNNGKVVLAMTVNPYTVPGVAGVFSSDVLYQFKVDNTGDFVEDLVFQVTFNNLQPNQQFRLVGPVAPPPGTTGPVNQLIAGGPTLTATANDNQVKVGGNGQRAFIGRRDDPFFIDLIYVRGVLTITPPIARPPGKDLFNGLNVSIIVVEVPAAQLLGTTGNTIRVWATTNRARATTRTPLGDSSAVPFVQVDRMGLPAINTALVFNARKDEFNRRGPDGDAAFKADAVSRILTFNGNNLAHAQAVANTVFPDVLTLDVTSNAGFVTGPLNGRRWDDDFIDTELAILTNGLVTTDNVAANDVPFLNDFPFFAPEHPPSDRNGD